MNNLNKTSPETGIFFNVQKFSVHDGPGIRTVLFAKGCPLKCLWCSNPESQKFEPELAYKRSNCIGVKLCGLCIKSCEKKAIAPCTEGGVTIDRMLCDNCGLCIDSCPANALLFFGQKYTIEDLVNKVAEDDNFYWRSGGGPTISGGEPLAQPKFVGNLLETLNAKGYHNVIETCGQFDLNNSDVAKALKNTSFIFYDIKTMNPDKHKAHTGYYNHKILSNLLELSKKFTNIEIVVRTPVIPGFNDTQEDIEQIAYFLKKIHTLKDYELLSYHAFGAPKYAQLGRKYALTSLKPIEHHKLERLQSIANEILGLGQYASINKY